MERLKQITADVISALAALNLKRVPWIAGI